MDIQGTKVLVTGGAGFIGSHLVDALINEGCHVRVIDNLVNGRRDNLKQHDENENFEFFLGDITDPFDVAKVMKDVGIVYNLACLGVRHSIKHPFENHRVNAEGTLFLLEEGYRQGVDIFVQCSTSEVYGTAETVPMTEEHPTNPHTVYGASKLAGDAYARAYNKTYGMKTTVIRPFNTFGPRSHYEGDAGEMIPRSIIRALSGKGILVFGDGSQTRDFTYVEDTARGMVAAVKCEALAGRILNIGSNFEISMKEVAGKITHIVNPDAAINFTKNRPGDVLRLYADSSMFLNLTGWNPSVSFDEGLGKTISWFRNEFASNNFQEQEIAYNWE